LQVEQVKYCFHELIELKWSYITLSLEVKLMQKLIISILCMLIMTGSVYAKANLSGFRQGIQQYKAGNYVGCMQAMQDVIRNDPGNAVARYYLAITYVKLGNKDEATKEYNNVISLNPESKLIEYAKLGLSYLSGTATPGTPATPSTPGATPESLPQINVPGDKNDFMSDKVKDSIREKGINKIINDANSKNGQVDPNVLRKLDRFPNKKSENTVTPTKEQVAQAMQVLSSVGMSGMSQNINPEAMEMNMLMSSLGGQNMNGMNGSGYGYNPMSSMYPMMMMSQGSDQKMDPELMQTMITTMMMPNMTQMSGGNNDNNY
jgi:hypothetical protein